MLHLSSRIVKTLLLCTCLTSVAMASNHSKPDMEIHFSALSVLRKETVEMKRLEAKKLIEQQKQRKVFEEVRKEEELKAQEAIDNNDNDIKIIEKPIVTQEILQNKTEETQENKEEIQVEDAEEIQSSIWNMFGIFKSKPLDDDDIKYNYPSSSKNTTESKRPLLADVQNKFEESSDIIKEKQEYLKHRPLEQIKPDKATFEGEVKIEKLPHAAPKHAAKPSKPVVKQAKPIATIPKEKDVINLPPVLVQKDEHKATVVKEEFKKDNIIIEPKPAVTDLNQTKVEKTVKTVEQNNIPTPAPAEEVPVMTSQGIELEPREKVQIIELKEKNITTDLGMVPAVKMPEPKLEQTPIPKASEVPDLKSTTPIPQENTKSPDKPAEIAKEEPKQAMLEMPKVVEVEKVKEPEVKQEEPKLDVTPSANATILTYKAGVFELTTAQNNEIAKMLKKYDSKQRIKVIGYASDTVTGDDKKSNARRIALQRVIEVRKALLQNGIDQMSIVVQAMGQESNTQSLSKDRVEISIE